MARLPLMLVLLLSVFLAPSTAQAARYSCKAARELAKLGAHDNDTIVVDPDDARRECRFSVNGEPAGSPPRTAIITAINLLRTGKPSVELSNKNVDWLAFLLLAASTESGISELQNLLSKYASELAKCFAALESNSTSAFPAFTNEKDMLCRVVPTGGAEIGFSSAHQVQVQGNEVDFLVVGVRRSKGASFLFIPFGRFRGQPLK